jgi:hypothetical protein
MSTTKNTKKNTPAIEWPSTHFTIDDVQAKYPDVVNITLRFRVKKAIENKEIVTIGKIKPAIGRPKLVFAKTNPSKELLEAAKVAGVLSLDEKATVPVAELKAEKKVVKTPPVPTESVTVEASS